MRSSKRFLVIIIIIIIIKFKARFVVRLSKLDSIKFTNLKYSIFGEIPYVGSEFSGNVQNQSNSFMVKL